LETPVLDSDTINGMSKRVRTVAVHARIAEEDVAEIDKAADEELTSRSNMLARIVREWAKRRASPKKRDKR
jgi:metal-responsive CopG/Arc/MetJ family transcriptional regulator